MLVACGSPEDGGERGKPDSGNPGDGGDGDGDGDGGGDGDGDSCGPGFAMEGGSCEDIDECAGDNDCDANATCTNTEGSYDCTCDSGFTGDGESCAELGCSAGICDPNATCGDDDGCECGPGFTGDGESCGDVNECEGTFECADDAACLNTYGGYDCECEPTFAGDGKTDCKPLCEIALADDSVCASDGLCRIDRDEAVCDACAPGYEGNGKTCTASADGCGAACDGEGSDEEDNAVCDGDGGCECAPGYAGTPGSCEDVDECAEADACGDNTRCLNTPGGFFCACQAGFTKNAAGECVDKNECEAAASPCHPNAECTNSAGSFTCACADGYEGDGSICRDTNECMNEAACAENASCTNTRGGFECSCTGDFTGDDPNNCYCDLSGMWAMRQDVDTCWEQLNFPGTDVALIAQGEMEATVWELHKLVYDGDVITVEKKGCSTDNAPDLQSPFFAETYSSYIPDDLFDTLGLFPGVPIEEAGIVPGSMFTTDPEAAVIGIDLGDDPLDASWPASFEDVNAVGGATPAWADTDEDGTPGVTVWPRLPTQTPDSGTGKYSYLPINVTPDANVERRTGCMSVAARVVTQLEVDVVTCKLMTGTVLDVKSEGRVYGFTMIDEADKLDPISCDPEDWEAMSSNSCPDESNPDCPAFTMRLDGDQNQAQTTKTTFELVRIGDLDDDVTCLDVRDQLREIERDTPTITCRD